MVSKNELKEIDIKNCMYYYFDDIMKARDIYSKNNFLDEKIYKNIFIYDISYITFMGSIDKIDGFIRIYDGIRYLVIIGHSWFDERCDSIKYLISEKGVLRIVLIIILQKSKLIHIVLYL